VVTLSVLLVLGADAGGYFPDAWRLGTLALVAFAASALVARPSIRIGRREWFLVGAFGALTSWIAISSLWSYSASASLLEADRTAVYLAGIIAVIVVAQRATMAQILRGVVGAVTLVCAYALAVRVFDSGTLDPVEGGLLYRPVGYANAFGILTALAIMLAVGLGLAARARLEKIGVVASLTVLVPSLYLTSSRGAWVALAIGLVFGLWCAVPALGAGMVVLLLSLAVTGALLVGSQHGQGLALGDENRPHYWHIALNDAAAHPLLGSGAGTYSVYWLRNEPAGAFARDAHSLYIESLAELGPLGLSLVIAALGMPLLVIRRGEGTVLAAAAGAYVAFLVHAGLDWDWEVPAVTLAGLFCGVALLVGKRGSTVPASSGTRRLLFALLLIIAVAVAVRAKTSDSYPV
jgi:O-antigen ligase